MAKEVLRREYKPEYKREAVKLVKGGLSSAQVARDLGIPSNMVSRWVRESEADPTADVFDYIERFYNGQRRHSTLGYVSPIDFEHLANLFVSRRRLLNA